MNIGETLSISKSGDQSVTSNTTLQVDTELRFPVVAGETYTFTQIGAWGSTTACGFKWAYENTGNPGVGTVIGRHNGTSTLGAASNLDLETARGANSGCADTLNQVITGKVDNSGGANGELRFKFAQNTSTGAASAVSKGTTLLTYTRIS